jgi:hypothetical protein
MSDAPYERFRSLARELAERDREIPASIEAARSLALEVRARALEALEAFRTEALASGVPHLTHLEVGPVEPDDKHVDALQVMIRRGRWELVCVAKSRGAVTLVGPYRRGKKEGPCVTLDGRGDELDRTLDERLFELLQEACAR